MAQELGNRHPLVGPVLVTVSGCIGEVDRLEHDAGQFTNGASRAGGWRIGDAVGTIQLCSSDDVIMRGGPCTGAIGDSAYRLGLRNSQVSGKG